MKKFHFNSNDNIYKLFQIIDNLSSNHKEVIFNIDPNNDFFNNKWWLKVVLERAKEKWIKIVFIIENSKQEYLMKIFHANYIWYKLPIRKKIYKIFKDFFDNFKSKNSFYKRHYNIFKVFFLCLEIFLVFLVFYLVYNLIIPKTDIYIQPHVKTKHLIQKFYVYPFKKKDNFNLSQRSNFPYYKNSFIKTYDVKIPVKDISYITKPSSGKVKLFNKTSKWISLKAYTELIVDGLIFKFDNWVYIPPKDSGWNPGTTTVSIKASEKDIEWNLIWSRWNIKKWTKLYVKKMYSSKWQKLIYAESLQDFQGWETNPKWKVSIEDIDTVKKQLLDKFKNNLKKSIFTHANVNWDNQFPLIEKDLYGFENISYNLSAQPWDEMAFINWKINWKIFYNYIKKSDLKKTFKNYLDKRIVSEKNFLWWDQNSIENIDLINKSYWLYLWTFSINSLLWYDFESDYNNIKEQILQDIKGKPIEDAKNIIISNPVVSAVEIKTTNGLDVVSNLNSRIFIHITK